MQLSSRPAVRSKVAMGRLEINRRCRCQNSASPGQYPSVVLFRGETTMVRSRAAGLLQAAVLPLVLVGCASSSEDEPAENVGESHQQIVGALSKKFSVSLPRGVSIAEEAVAAGRTLSILDRARVQDSTGVL